MNRENIMFFENHDKSHTMTDLYLNHNIFFGYKNSYNYYDINVNKILLFVKSDNEYIIRYNDANKEEIVPFQLKIIFFFFLMNYTCIRAILQICLFLVMIENVLENVEKYGIRLIN